MPEIRVIRDFASNDRGRIAFLRDSSGKAPALVVAVQGGRIARTVPLDADRALNGRGWSGLSWVGGDRYFLLRDLPKDDKGMEGWWVDVATATASPIPGFSTSVLSEGAGFPDGDIVVKGGLHYFPGGCTGDDNL